MNRSRARLLIDGGRPLRVSASSPQRWNRTQRAADGWTEAIHQLVGDGLFGGDFLTTSVAARGPSRLVVRSVAATPLRGSEPSAACVHLSATGGSQIVYLPGPLLPQRGSESTQSLRIDVDADSAVFAASIVLPGRLAMGERAAFHRLRFRTTARVVGELGLAEDSEVLPSQVDLDGPAMLAGAAAVVSFIALGHWPPASPVWWDLPIAHVTGVVAGASSLRTGGVIVRALCADLGAALQLTTSIEPAVRALPSPAFDQPRVC